MDTWQDEQVKRMQVCCTVNVTTNSGFRLIHLKIGGNLSFKEFMKSYQPADQGGYKEGASPYDTYHCWAAAQYREKVGLISPFVLLSTCFNVEPCHLVGCSVSWT